ncbi:concanavalin A-like lectin/glucanase domain-containing protein [Phyllosticta citribraziliensis]|uniref:Concanavalin A-like lectin/glucanase domain-containing protein n=1 Tax=Phyllosticta citribraziliensis TaxID=989973 RepID=A0ABR1LG23_9PEZI
MPGWSSPYQSWGYHGDDGHKYDNMSIIEDGHPYGQGDTVGAGVDFANREIFFTKNGKRLGTSFSGENVKGKLFPMVGFHACGVKIRTNFGTREFKHPVDWCKVQPAGEAPAA